MTEHVSLTRYEAARAALAEAVRVDEVQEVRNTGLQMKAYAKIAKNRQMQADANTIVLRAERKLGVLVQSAKEMGEFGRGRASRSNVAGKAEQDEDKSSQAEHLTEAPTERLTLEAVGIDRKLSSRAQKWARMGEAEFEARLEAERDRVLSGSVEHAAPVNGARSTMAGRQEPAESLDFFPTPPWATRALIEDVLRWETVDGSSVWEPACGEGHISGVLEEYFETVFSTDIFDYSADGRSAPGWRGKVDFLNDSADEECDWVITNPPFSGSVDRALEFARLALPVARRGVALFVRAQWLEGVERYERLFSQTPPSLIAQFAERVPLCRGRWAPQGSTASQYCWVIWFKDSLDGCAFEWIPPGRRVERSRPDDVERFTAHPVRSIRNTPERGSGTAREASGGSAPSDGIAGLSEDQGGQSEGGPVAVAADVEIEQDGAQPAPHTISELRQDGPAGAAGAGGLPSPADAIPPGGPANLTGGDAPSLAGQSLSDFRREAIDTVFDALGEVLSVAAGLGGPAAAGGGEGNGQEPVPAELPHAGIATAELSSEQKNDIIRAGYARNTPVPVLAERTGLSRDSVKQRARTMKLGSRARQKAMASAFTTEQNRRRAR